MNKYLSGILVMLSLVLLSGCADADLGNDGTPNENGQTTEATTTSQGTEQVQTGPDTVARTLKEPMEEKAEPVTAYSAEDQAFFDGAIRLRDETYCDKISSTELKDRCKKDLSDAQVTEEAIAKNDPTVCDRLEGQRADLCKMQVDLAQSSADDFRELTEEERVIMDRAVTQKDASVCNEIESERKRENCRTNVDNVGRTQ